MKVIVGLGNPGKKYQNTRHNVGYMILDAFVKELVNEGKLKKDWRSHQKFSANIAWGEIEREKVLLAKPLTYMNSSGKSVKKIMDFYKVSIDDLWVCYDDFDLVLGRIRTRKKGTGGTRHKGVLSIAKLLGTPEFGRVRLGVGVDLKDMELEKYILEKFDSEEKETIKKKTRKIGTMLADIISGKL